MKARVWSMRIAGLAGFGLGLLVAAELIGPIPRLIWNASASMPVGFYRLTHEAVAHGVLVLVMPPESMRDLAAGRGYLPAGVPLVKPVAAISGDQICAEGGSIFINGAVVAQRVEADSHGRPMPTWTGCRILDDEVFLLVPDVPDSFDGRYFGAVPAAAVIGTLTSFWIP